MWGLHRRLIEAKTMNTRKDSPGNGTIIGDSTALKEVYELTGKVAASSATILLNGETGTGKELIARAIHEFSPRASGPFVRVNCGALSENLLESELFGHVKGAFTSAHETRTGRFEAAHGGTIFLDEINSLSFHLQVKLLRVLQEHEFERVGDTKTIRVDCRVVAATNRDLLSLVEEETFREDLYYRLNVIPIYIPPLRERREDIEPLVRHFLEIYTRENSKPILKIDEDALRFLANYDWPGNVRELQNYIERAVVLAAGDVFSSDLLPGHVRGEAHQRVGREVSADLEGLCSEFVARSLARHSENLHGNVVSLVEKELIDQVLKSCQGVQIRTASKLGINRNTLHKKIEEYGLEGSAR